MNENLMVEIIKGLNRVADAQNRVADAQEAYNELARQDIQILQDIGLDEAVDDFGSGH